MNELYKGYKIEPNPYVMHYSVSYMFTNMNDCDAAMGYGETIQECKNQIDEQDN